MSRFLLSCDWGTSSFRLRLVNIQNQSVVGQVTSGMGVGIAFNQWKSEGSQPDRESFFRKILTQSIQDLAMQTGMLLDGVPILLSGMASSSIGMQEVPYAEVPFALDSSNILIRHLNAQADFPHDILLLSGVRSSTDVMRGEETELIGIYEQSAALAERPATFIFPGTHAKHMYVRDGEMVDFKTFMTGEIFNLMATASILKDSVLTGHADLQESDLRDAFEAGVKESSENHILHTLFTVRTGQLFGLMNKKQNALYLSGLLIGAELGALKERPDDQLVLCGGENLSVLYHTALQTLGLGDRLTIVPAGLADKAAVAGHIRVYEHQKLTLNKANYE